MQPLSRQGLLALADQDEGLAVSIFLPTHGVGPAERQDGMRLRNLLREATHRLDAAGVREHRARRLLAPAAALVEQPAFWRAPGGGLALFLGQGPARHLQLPFRPRELVMVGQHFHVKPLLPLLCGDGRFYVLALSQGRVRLWKGDREGLRAVNLPGAPSSLADAMRLDDREEQLQLHEAGLARRGERPAAVFHGHGVGSDDAKDRILRYFREVDHGVRAAIRDANAPLLLAAVDYLVPIYHAASTYPHLFEQHLHCNPDRLGPARLHQQTWPLVRDDFAQAQRGAVARWRRLAGTELAIRDLDQVVLAAVRGAVETLLVPMNAERWGIADAAGDTIEIHERAQPGDVDLLDLAMVEALRHHGSAYPLDPGELPDASRPAAILRYDHGRGAGRLAASQASPRWLGGER
jgi:Bacterial archaeo-eukaryotic release factor family 7